jgi:hypothetical protein
VRRLISAFWGLPARPTGQGDSGQIARRGVAPLRSGALLFFITRARARVGKSGGRKLPAKESAVEPLARGGARPPGGRHRAECAASGTRRLFVTRVRARA